MTLRIGTFLVDAILIMMAFFLNATPTLGEAAPSPDDKDFFERKIRPLLSEHCFSCHSTHAKTIHGGFRLDSAEAIEMGGDSGKVVVAGKPEQSLLMQSVLHDGDIQMPPKGKLSDNQIELLRHWIARGAYYPKSSDPTEMRGGEIDYEEGRKFWAFQPAVQKRSPSVSDTAWPNRKIDSFVLAAMDHEGLKPTSRADRATLLRRLSFDLLGVPPSPQQIHDFVGDQRPDAYARLVDQFLDSPQYGETWGRWWLDLARYTDRTASWLYQTGQAHLYRDWIVNAMNEDLPFNEFIQRQLATDLMPETGPEDLPALGFLSLSPTYWKELKLPCEIINVIVADEWEERVDAISRTFLGLTVACARCHDHKYDPISSEDYYAFAGIIASSRQIDRPLISEEAFEPVRIARKQVADLEAKIAKLKKEKPQPKDQLDELAQQITAIKESNPLYDAPMANALSEESLYVVRAGKTPQDGTRLEYRAEPRDLPVYVRGNPNRPGPVVSRRFLKILDEDSKPYTNGSGRLELAESIITDAASLTARVIVNRVWLAHFGRGLVGTASNFGRQGNRPTHPELLDDLAARFMANGWSLKWLHREILLSSTWQQASSPKTSQQQSDPDNLWLARANPRRLTFEQWRDAMLCCTSDLDPKFGGPSVDLEARDNRRRTLYATIHRRDMSPTLMIHDFPDPTQHSPTRTSTITALQGLYALNGPLLLQQSERLVKRLHDEAPDNDRDRIWRAYWLLFSRTPSDHELKLGLAFLSQESESAGPNRWHQYAQVLLASNEFMFVD